MISNEQDGLYAPYHYSTTPDRSILVRRILLLVAFFFSLWALRRTQILLVRRVKLETVKRTMPISINRPGSPRWDDEQQSVLFPIKRYGTINLAHKGQHEPSQWTTSDRRAFIWLFTCLVARLPFLVGREQGVFYAPCQLSPNGRQAQSLI